MTGRPHLLSPLQRRILLIMLEVRQPMSAADLATKINSARDHARISRTLATLCQFGFAEPVGGRSTAHPCQLTKPGLDMAANLEQAERAPVHHIRR